MQLSIQVSKAKAANVSIIKNLGKSCLSLFLVLGLVACKDEGAGGWGAVTPQVTYLTATTEPLNLVSQLPGRLEAIRTAEVRAQVAGIILEKKFQEGSEVKAGDVLFQIDPAPYQAAVALAQGQLARAKATLHEAQSREKRLSRLKANNSASQQELETAEANLLRARAEIQVAEANLTSAKLNLNYAEVKAPISGRIGKAFVTEGMLVGQGEATLLAKIQQLDPIYADFKQAAAQTLQMQQALAQGKIVVKNEEQQLELEVAGTHYPLAGKLLFADLSVEESTGQITLRGEFPNPNAQLLPGLFARVTLNLGTDPAAFLLPQRAIKRLGDGQAYILLVNANNEVEQRLVTLGEMYADRWHLLSGVKEGDKVITSTTVRLQPGAKVEAKPTADTANTRGE